MHTQQHAESQAGQRHSVQCTYVHVCKHLSAVSFCSSACKKEREEEEVETFEPSVHAMEGGGGGG